MKSFNFEEFKIFNKKLLNDFIVMLVLFFFIVIVTELMFKYNPSYVNNIIKNLSNTMKINDNVKKEFIDIFFNNVKVSIVSIIIGVIPYIYLSFITPIVNAWVIGLVLANAKIMKQNVLLTLLLGILPHGVFEITAFLYASSIGVYLTKNISNYTANKYEFFKKVVPNILIAFLFIIIPLLFISTFIEVFISFEFIHFL
ncbi:stage II sporulation protein M [Clostridium sporogenes]|uniref:stage II sporulation protein M n=1 Tax=Clostridium sporogenes TaxID=1509 RepID=UPI0005EE3EC5|nr:stage II sporulation protein M [Clostridium sporogenes]